MTTTTLRPTRHDLAVDQREPLTELPNTHLADLTDYSLQLRQAHWNVKGPQFVALHGMFEDMLGEVNEYSDLVAERAVMLGGQARGTLQAAAAGSRLPQYPVQATTANDHLNALVESVARLGAGIRSASATAGELGDDDTADLFTEVSRGLDKQLWYFEAHLEI